MRASSRFGSDHRAAGQPDRGRGKREAQRSGLRRRAAQRLRHDDGSGWIGATILVGIAGVAALFGIVQKGIIAPCSN
ncbi:MAG: hypothetical protein HPM95_06695 [Alphaproteobacteria bacterium]|nr:hypothetical protein [Alphaproteobacteria bacterium]